MLTEFRIVLPTIDHVVDRFHADADPENKWVCIALLDERLRSQRLVGTYRIQAWSPRYGWLTYSIPGSR